MGLFRKRKDVVAKFMRKERREAKEIPLRPFTVKIKGRRWEKVSGAKHGVSAVLVAAYWKSMGFKVRIRKLKKKRFSVDIQNFVTATDFPTVQRVELAKKGKLFKAEPKSFKSFIKKIKEIV